MSPHASSAENKGMCLGVLSAVSAFFSCWCGPLKILESRENLFNVHQSQLPVSIPCDFFIEGRWTEEDSCRNLEMWATNGATAEEEVPARLTHGMFFMLPQLSKCKHCLRTKAFNWKNRVLKVEIYQTTHSGEWK